jgi:hypothetical protein
MAAGIALFYVDIDSLDMAELVANCPRCGATSITFDVTATNYLGKEPLSEEQVHEVFGVCRSCSKGTIFVVRGELDQAFETKATLNNYVKVRGYISLKDQATVAPPQHVPSNIANVFREATTCLSVECWNAAGVMFRVCVDLATRPMLPKEDVQGLNAKKTPLLGSLCRDPRS